MRLLAIVFLMVAGCESASYDEILGPPTPLELAETLGYHQIRSAVLKDVRVRRELQDHLNEGRNERIAPGSKDLPSKELEIFTIRDDPKDQRDAVAETALYSPSVKQYLYHYIGGPRHLDLWMGPYPLERDTK